MNLDTMKFGYNNFKDFRNSNFGKWSFEATFFVTCTFLTFWFGMEATLESINQYIFSPATAMLTACGIIVMDWLSGMYRGWTKSEFSTKKMQRIIPKLVANIGIMAMLFYIHKFFITPLGIELLTNIVDTSKTVLAGTISTVHALSFLSNCTEAELIHGKIAKLIKDKVDKHKNTIDDLI